MKERLQQPRLKNLLPPEDHHLYSRVIDLLADLRCSWGYDTSIDRNWSVENLGLGQCAITALLVQSELGGSIVKDSKHSHYWNIVQGIPIDLTRDQFGYETVLSQGEYKTREDILGSSRAKEAKTSERYATLLFRVRLARNHRP